MVPGHRSSLATEAKPAAQIRGNRWQAQEFIHATGEQRQPQAFQPSGTVTVAVSVRKAIVILTPLPLAVKGLSETVEFRLRKNDVERHNRQPVAVSRGEMSR